MKKFNSLICASILAVVGLFGTWQSASAFDPNNTMFNSTVSQTNWTRYGEYLIFNAYTQGVGPEDFTGSTTTDGGSSTFKSGLVNVEHLSGSLYVSWYGSASALGGTSTIRIYGLFGTTTGGVGTAGAVMLINPYTSPDTVLATGTVFTINTHPACIAVSTQGLSGTMTNTIGIFSNTAR